MLLFFNSDAQNKKEESKERAARQGSKGESSYDETYEEEYFWDEELELVRATMQPAQQEAACYPKKEHKQMRSVYWWSS